MHVKNSLALQKYGFVWYCEAKKLKCIKELKSITLKRLIISHEMKCLYCPNFSYIIILSLFAVCE